MIQYQVKDITTVERGIVLHGVNCQGVMGSGVAAAIRSKWPKVYNDYVDFTTKTARLLGRINPVHISDELHVINCFNQVYYGRDPEVKYADPAAIASCLEEVGSIVNLLQLPVYMPRIGCGLGGLNWENDVLIQVEWAVGKFFPPDQNVIVCDLK